MQQCVCGGGVCGMWLVPFVRVVGETQHNVFKLFVCEAVIACLLMVVAAPHVLDLCLVPDVHCELEFRTSLAR